MASLWPEQAARNMGRSIRVLWLIHLGWKELVFGVVLAEAGRGRCSINSPLLTIADAISLMRDR